MRDDLVRAVDGVITGEDIPLTLVSCAPSKDLRPVWFIVIAPGDGEDIAVIMGEARKLWGGGPFSIASETETNIVVNTSESPPITASFGPRADGSWLLEMSSDCLSSSAESGELIPSV